MVPTRRNRPVGYVDSQRPACPVPHFCPEPTAESRGRSIRHGLASDREGRTQAPVAVTTDRGQLHRIRCSGTPAVGIRRGRKPGIMDGRHILEEQIALLGIAEKMPTVIDNARLTEQFLNDARQCLTTELDPTSAELDVIVLGSLARYEASEQSDFDYLVIAYELPEHVARMRELLAAADNCRERIGKLSQPGRTGLFGHIVAAPELTERIGLEQDTNQTHSRRILILEESVSVFRPDLNDKLIRGILSRYLVDYEKPHRGVPRFLLNDILRYWRTIAVDYQAKRWEQQKEWGLRYLKLLISRKLGFAGTLASLLLCEEATVTYFANQFMMPPLARLAQVHEYLEPQYQESLKEAFVIAEEFALFLRDEDARNEAKKILGRGDIRPDSTFAKMKSRSDHLQLALQDIFFRSSHFQDLSIKYLSF